MWHQGTVMFKTIFYRIRMSVIGVFILLLISCAGYIDPGYDYSYYGNDRYYFGYSGYYKKHYYYSPYYYKRPFIRISLITTNTITTNAGSRNAIAITVIVLNIDINVDMTEADSSGDTKFRIKEMIDSLFYIKSLLQRGAVKN
jgi:hypothetical protein